MTDNSNKPRFNPLFGLHLINIGEYARLLIGRPQDDQTVVMYRLHAIQARGRVNIVPVYLGREKPKASHYIICWLINKALFLLNLLLGAYAAFVLLPIWLFAQIILLVLALLMFSKAALRSQTKELSQISGLWKSESKK